MEQRPEIAQRMRENVNREAARGYGVGVSGVRTGGYGVGGLAAGTVPLEDAPRRNAAPAPEPGRETSRI
eukprot:3817030-Alexandrium_andersonii.AAC.1